MGLAGAGVAVAIGSLGYGIYAGQEAQKAQKAAAAQSEQEFQQQQNEQASQYQSQLQQEQATTAANLAQEQQTAQQTAAAQQKALADEKASIGTNTTTLSNDLAQQQAAAFALQQPLITDQMQALGLQNSGALPAAEAKYQAQLQSQAQNQLAQYQIGANSQLTQDSNAATADQVRQSEQNSLLNIQNQEQNMSQNFATTNVNNQNDAAYQQYIDNLNASAAESQQASANAYANFGGQLGSGLINYYGNRQNNQNLVNALGGGSNSNPALMALYSQQSPSSTVGSFNYYGNSPQPTGFGGF